ncbi:MAG: hypothetical protein P1V20_02630 [Verrucomicrobiales bacterium]|nr:hypothetical protein [Verrucomicrobiales bacterium]
MKSAIILFLFTISTIACLQAVDFDSEIHPILKSRCGKCHMEGEAKGKVALDKDMISKQIGDGGSIIPGDVKKSDLHWTMTLSPDDDLAMPPKGKRVPKEEIDLIAKWIEEGAKLGGGGAPAPTGAMDSMSDSMTGDSMAPSMSGDTMGGDTMSGGAMAGAPPVQKPWKGVFKNNKGMQVPATLTRIDGDRAILKLPDGKEYRYPIAMFASETQDIVKQFQAGTLAPAE